MWRFWRKPVPVKTLEETRYRQASQTLFRAWEYIRDRRAGEFDTLDLLHVKFEDVRDAIRAELICTENGQ